MVQIITLIAIAVLVAVDQLIKYIVSLKLIGAGTVVAIPGFIGWYYAENTGASFSILTGKVNFLIVITAIIILLGLVYLLYKKTKFNLMYIGVALALAGGIGNFIDRISRGFVIDYIRTLFMDFPIFNFADCLICVGAALMVIYTIVDIVRECKTKKVNDNE